MQAWQSLGPALLGACCLVGCAQPQHWEGRADAATPARVERTIEIVARTPHLPNYPCLEQCHSKRAPDPRQRELTELHGRIRIEHAPVIRWCDFCHQLDNIDKLHLVDGRIISFDESFRLCGQCHGEKLGQWSRNMHGLQTGTWNGVARRRACTACHDPHAPSHITLQSLPPPRGRGEEEH